MNCRPFWIRSLSDATVINIATLGVGQRVKAPGTVGSLAGLLVYALFFINASIITQVALFLGFLYLGVVFCEEAEVRLQKRDPNEIILDEFVVIPLCFFGFAPLQEPFPAWLLLLAGFIIFRVLDILKPFGIDTLQQWPGGKGIVMDDLAAAALTCVYLHILFEMLGMLGCFAV